VGSSVRWQFKDPQVSSLEQQIVLLQGSYTDTPAQKLMLSSSCNGQWLVKNPNPIHVVFGWDVFRGNEQGSGIVPAAQNGQAGQMVFATSSGSTKLVRVYAGGTLQANKTTNPVVCRNPVPAIVGKIEAKLSWNPDKTSLKLRPNKPLAVNQNYTVFVGLKDPFATSFKTSSNSNNQTPVAQNQQLMVAENSSNDSIIGQITASDPEDQNLSYTLSTDGSNGALTLTDLGQIKVKDSSKLDYESQTTSYPLTIAISDDGQPVATSTITATVNISDINEAPKDLTLSSTTVEKHKKGAIIGQIMVNDPDNGDTVAIVVNDDRFEVIDTAESNIVRVIIPKIIGGIRSTNNNFKAITPQVTTSKILKLKANQNLRQESNPSLNLTITATDQGGLSTVMNKTITIINTNTAPNISDQAFNVPENSPVATVVGSITASDGEEDALSYSIESGNDANVFELDNNQLKVKNANLDYEAITSYLLAVKVSDPDGLLNLRSVILGQLLKNQKVQNLGS
jgi:hypothetical protein